MEFERSKQIKEHLDIAPLIDIVFQLLIFFLLTNNFIMQQGIKITLPQAKTAVPQEEQRIVIFISENSEIFLNEQQTNIDDLKSILQRKFTEDGKKTVILKADKKIDLGLAVKVMDIAKDSGFENVVISTDIQQG